ncbi:MAG: SRPBCC family protein [Acidimicrobiales bacterium]
MSTDETRVVSARLEVAAPSARVFELIADPAAQPRWDGNDNLAHSEPGQRVRRVGAVFTTRLTNGQIRENHVVDFVEGTRLAWRPAEPGLTPPGHEWSFELEARGPERTLVTHTYDWRELTDEARVARARATTPERLLASLERLRALAEGR